MMGPRDQEMPGRSAKAFAPGKAILLGEHAVVYGYPALAGPLTQGVTVRLEATTRSGVVLKGVDGLSPLVHALRKCAQAFRVQGVEAEVTADLPTSVGLGSSAAVSVALVRAFAQAAQISMRPQGLIDRASDLERDFHGSTSGIDPNVSFERRLIRYVKGHRGSPVMLTRPLEAVVWVVEPRGSTRDRVAEVRAKRDADPGRSEQLFREIGALVDDATEALESGAFERVGRAMRENHLLLRSLGLSTPGLDAACARLEAMGAWGAKLTGAGGGGAVVGLVPEAGPLVAKLKADGQQVLAARWERVT